LPANLGFKFFVLLVLQVCLAMVVQAQTSGHCCGPAINVSNNNGNAPNNHTMVVPNQSPPDTIPHIIPAPEIPDTVPVPMPMEGETMIPFYEDEPLPEDTIAMEPPRQTGTGTILDARVDYAAADSIFFDLRNQKVFLYGDADLKYDNIHLQADFVEIDFRRNEVYASGLPDTLGEMQGLPVFTEGMQSFQSREMRYNFETRRGRTIGVITEEADGFIHGEIVKIQPNKVIHAQDGKYTTCDHPEPHFHIGFRRAKIIPDDKIVTSFAYLVIEGVPLPLVLPFGFFPNKRGQASGILVPSFTENAQRGFGLERGGFYWGINEYMDLALRGDIYSRGSWATSLESTYRARYRFSGNFNLGYSIHVEGERELPDYQRRRDFRVIWNHNQDQRARPNSHFSASVNAGSSNFTRFNQVSDQEYLSNTFSSSISYRVNWAGGYNLSTNLRHSQNTLNRRVDLSLPEVAFSVARFHPLRRAQPRGDLRWYENISMTYNMNARNQISTPDSLLFQREVFSRMRNGMNHTIPVTHSFNLLRHFNVSNSANFQSRWYLNTIRRDWDPDAMVIQAGDTLYGRVVTDTVPGFRMAHDFNLSTSLNTRLYGMVQFRRGALRAVRHVMSPSLSFTYRPDFADPFWGYYDEYYNPALDETVQYSIFEQGLFGTPMAGRSGNISLSISNNLEMKVRSRRDTIAQERKIALIDNLTISGGYDVARDSLNFNDIRLAGRTRLFGNFDVSYSSTWTVYDTDTLGRRVNRFLWDTRGKPFQMSNASWSFVLNYSLNSRARPRADAAGGDRMIGVDGAGPINGGPGDDLYRGMPNGTPELPEEPLLDAPAPINGIDLSVPWNLRFSYQFNYGARYQPLENRFTRELIQNLSVTGDVNLTPNWRIGFRSGYDFQRNEITYTSVNIYRDLHCWEMLIDWVPFGFRKFYSLTIRVKSSVLQDLKLTRRTSHMDQQLMRF
jgi:lipopolysaccharide assembly outer membrane protein LptD (OstA)